MRHYLLQTAILLACLATPVVAQEASTYTPADEIAIQQCIETVRDINANAKPGEQEDARTCIGQVSNDCQAEPGNGSTIGISQCNARETSWWDGYLNDNYAALQESLSVEAFAELKKAQRAWIAFRDAECQFQYARWGYGTMRSIGFSSCMLNQTAERALSLAELLTDVY